MYHIFFIHSSVNGHLGCCHVLDIVNSSAMKIEKPISFQIGAFSPPRYMSWFGLLDHMCYAVLSVTQSHPTLCDPWDCSPPGSSVHEDSLGKNTGLGCHALLQEIFPTQGSNSGLLHCRQILQRLSHQESPRILEWVAYSFHRGSSQARNQTGVSCIADRFFTSWVTREVHWIIQ